MKATGYMDDNHILMVVCTECGAELVSYVAVCSPGNSQPALYVEPCENCVDDGDTKEELQAQIDELESTLQIMVDTAEQIQEFPNDVFKDAKALL